MLSYGLDKSRIFPSRFSIFAYMQLKKAGPIMSIDPFLRVFVLSHHLSDFYRI